MARELQRLFNEIKIEKEDQTWSGFDFLQKLAAKKKYTKQIEQSVKEQETKENLSDSEIQKSRSADDPLAPGYVPDGIQTLGLA